MIIAIDPGPDLSAWLVLDGRRVVAFGHEANADVLARVHANEHGCGEVVIEMIASYGMPVGVEVFETCVWIGRYEEAWRRSIRAPCSEPRRVFRRDVKLHLCGQSRAKDGNVRQALIDLYGGKVAAIGRKATPGPLYGISGDVWAALAVAITATSSDARVTA